MALKEGCQYTPKASDKTNISNSDFLGNIIRKKEKIRSNSLIKFSSNS